MHQEDGGVRLVIAARNLPVFSKLIGSLAKIGDDLFLEPTNDVLHLRSLNSARSAFVSVQIRPHFFEQYQVSGAPGSASKCKLQLKACVAVFRSSKSVERCTIAFDERDSRVTVELTCKMGMKKTHRLNYEECEPVLAVYNKDACPNHLRVKPRLLTDGMQNFHTLLEEVTLTATRRRFSVRSFVDYSKKQELSGAMYTEFFLEPAEFEQYQLHGEPGELTFCFKEFRAFLGFCEFAGQPVSLWFEVGGRPLVASVSFLGAFDVDFVLATLYDPVPSSSAASTPQPQASTHRRPPSRTSGEVSAAPTTGQPPSSSSRRSRPRSAAESSPGASLGLPSPVSVSMMADSISVGSPSAGKRPHGQEEPPLPAKAPRQTMEAALDGLVGASAGHTRRVPGHGSLPTKEGVPTALEEILAASAGVVHHPPPASRSREVSGESARRTEGFSMELDEEEDSDDYVQGTPPSSSPERRRMGNSSYSL